jgi:ribonuclease Z
MKLRKPLLIVLALLALAGAAAYAFRSEMSLALAQRVAARHLSSTGLEGLADGLHVGLCGAGSPFPDDKRGGPCTVVVAGSKLLVFDAGNTAARHIGKMGFALGRIERVFLTHFHSDHIDGLGELLLQRWVQGGHKAPLPVHGPQGVEQVVGGLMQAYRLDQGYRVSHHGDAVVPASGFGGQARPFDVAEEVPVFKDGDLEVVAFAVDHSPAHPAVGYRITYKDRRVVISGDTKRSEAVARQAQGADLLLHEALSTTLVDLMQQTAQRSGRVGLAKVLGDIHDYHATPEQAAEVAQQAKVGMLLLHHIVPTLPPLPGLEKVFLGRAPQIYSGPLRVGQDGDFVSLPAGRKDINVGRRF